MKSCVGQSQYSRSRIVRHERRQVGAPHWSQGYRHKHVNVTRQVESRTRGASRLGYGESNETAAQYAWSSTRTSSMTTAIAVQAVDKRGELAVLRLCGWVRIRHVTGYGGCVRAM
jgi:hypothetical protein